jgi:hypothetical protein
MLSLSPRYDLFKFSFPKDFLPQEVLEKYDNILSKNSGVIVNAIDYLNESIQGVNLPGINDVLITQVQHGHNSIERSRTKLNVEPVHDITYQSSANLLSNINKEIKITFRMNQGLYNYFMLYETIFHHACKPISKDCEPILYIEILDEEGVSIAKVKLIDVYINGIDGLDFTYNKIERDAGTFDATLKFNNIDFDFEKTY